VAFEVSPYRRKLDLGVRAFNLATDVAQFSNNSGFLSFACVEQAQNPSRKNGDKCAPEREPQIAVAMVAYDRGAEIGAGLLGGPFFLIGAVDCLDGGGSLGDGGGDVVHCSS
jgi:hypothetical protein